MTKDEVNKKQEETLNNLKKYNKERNTEIADDMEGNPTVVTQWTDEVKGTELSDIMDWAIENLTEDPFELSTLFRMIREYAINVHESRMHDLAKSQKFIEADEIGDDLPDNDWQDVEITDNHPLGLLLLCQYCGSVAYQGQIHGMGYCKEKVQYEL